MNGVNTSCALLRPHLADKKQNLMFSLIDIQVVERESSNCKAREYKQGVNSGGFAVIPGISC